MNAPHEICRIAGAAPSGYNGILMICICISSNADAIVLLVCFAALVAHTVVVRLLTESTRTEWGHIATRRR